MLIGSTLALAIVAIFGPAYAEKFSSWLRRPRLSLIATSAPPDCHRTIMHRRLSPSQVLSEPCYFFRFRIRNGGRSQARKCEVVVEGLEIADAAQRFVRFENYTPVRLKWDAHVQDFVDINPGRELICLFFTIPNSVLQKLSAEMREYVELDHKHPPEIGMVLDVESVLNVQPSRLPSGKYRFLLALYSENAPSLRYQMTVNWSGRWQDSQPDMLRECVIQASAAS